MEKNDNFTQISWVLSHFFRVIFDQVRNLFGPGSEPKFFAFLLPLCLTACQPSAKDPHQNWEVYNGSKDGNKYSSLSQIDTSNVQNLQVAWTYHTRDADTASHSQIQCNPIIIGNRLFAVSPQMKLFALNAATGKPIWTFDPYASSSSADYRNLYHVVINCRGVAYWSDGKNDQRIFYTAGSHTYAINANTGAPITSFGDSGSIDLHDGLGRDVHDLLVDNSSPGIIYKDLIILGTRVEESPPAAPGHIRAYDVRTGALRWIFHSIPQPGEFGYDTWEDSSNYAHIGGANVWSGFTLDEKRGILFAPTGSATYDFYGGKRKGANLFADCLLALDAATGKRIWHFQFVHHDLWDRDLPTAPVLLTLHKDGRNIDAVAQPTKSGMVYVFDRETGKPVFDIPEVPVDTISELKGEKPWPTQPVPVKPAPFARQTLDSNDINPYLPDSIQRLLKKQMAGYRYGHMFIPPGTIPELVFPGYDGGAEWGGPALDPLTSTLYINANEMAWIQEMKPVPGEKPRKENWLQAAHRLYNNHCQTCHGSDRAGTGNNPSLLLVKAKYKEDDIITLLNSGRRMMPSFRQLSQEEKKALAAFILEQKSNFSQPFHAPAKLTDSADWMPYRMQGYTKFLSPDGKPAISPPWGTLNAINLQTGEISWKIPLGEYEDYRQKGIPPTGTENYGGPAVTAGGLLFIAATRDGKFRAFNKYTGRLLWEFQLPAPGFASPAIYECNGREFIVIACGGGKLGTPSGDSFIAFALPENK